MTLVEADVLRLQAQGFSGFCREMSDGSLQLVNLDGKCFFLKDGRCSIYSIRPEGCRLYPLIFDASERGAVLDDFCPYRTEFRFSSADRRLLRKSVETEDAEAQRRLVERD